MMVSPPLSWIERVIRIDSVTHRGNEAMIRFLVPLLEESGLKIIDQKFVENGETFHNLVAFNRAPDAPGLLVLNTHLDTVSPGSDKDWTRTGGDPFCATRVGDRVYGLGTADVKLDFLCKIIAARAALGTEHRPFALVGTYGEERGLIGAAKILESGVVKPRYALVGEPSNLELIYAHKGHFIATLGFALDPLPRGLQSFTKAWRGRAAHSSTPSLGTNALQKAFTDILKHNFGILSLDAGTDSNRVPDSCQAELVRGQTDASRRVFATLQLLEEMARDLKQYRDTRFSPATATLSMNMARTVKGRLELTFDVRLLPDTDAGKILQVLARGEKSCGYKVLASTHDAALKGSRNGKFLRAASKALRGVGIKPLSRTKASSTEAALYSLKGAEAIVFGPGISVGNVHRPNEYNSLRQIEAATRFYTAMLKMPPEAF